MLRTAVPVRQRKGKTNMRHGCRTGRRAALRSVLAAAVVLAAVGCSERPDPAADEPEAARQANEALRLAEQAMKNAGISISVEDIGDLDGLREQLPSPEELGDPATREQLETAIDQFYVVFDATNVFLDPMELLPLERRAAPAQIASDGLSVSDQALVHLYLGYLYALDAISRLVEVGQDLFEIEYPKDLKSGEIYVFRFLREEEIKALSPEQVLENFFGAAQRQAMVDALALLTGGTVEAAGLRPAVDKARFRRSAVYHIGKAAEVAEAISPEMKRALEQFDETFHQVLTRNILKEVERWGFVVEEMPADLKALVEEARRAP
jgi:hypothetical protein